MNEKDITKNVIDNSKLIHELGGRFEVEVFDVYMDGDFGLACCDHEDNISDVQELIDHELYLNHFPIWSSRKCTEFLMDKGYHVVIWMRKAAFEIWAKLSKNSVIICKASTEDVACQMAVIKILRGEL